MKEIKSIFIDSEFFRARRSTIFQRHSRTLRQYLAIELAMQIITIIYYYISGGERNLCRRVPLIGERQDTLNVPGSSIRLEKLLKMSGTRLEHSFQIVITSENRKEKNFQ